ncbi:TetR family transcriptional regulator [Paenibacillus sp. HN-1]|nr:MULTISPECIES: TetR family transcriptional regulator [Paenibacillus]MBY9079077.1 TetR family transcriptional regulator [Paenibacillus sp. CGMCC 1.18879]MBY9086855.1 TetR family transcriptional regulator [Paenibacillus sinensis]
MSESARRRIVLSAASRSFLRFGYKATTMDAVAKAARAEKGAGPANRSTKSMFWQAWNFWPESSDSVGRNAFTVHTPLGI